MQFADCFVIGAGEASKRGFPRGALKSSDATRRDAASSQSTGSTAPLWERIWQSTSARRHVWLTGC